MALVLYDSLTSKIVPFTPEKPDDVRIYVCGPTVYDFAHLGHARCYVIYDVLVRHLRASGFKVNYTRNITDIDDKILNRAREIGDSPAALALRFTEAFREDMARLGNLPPDVEPTVTDHVREIISLAEQLIASGAAYAVDGDVYFSVASFPEYGKLSHRNVGDMLAGASGRVDDSERGKRHPADFALWKGTTEEPLWPSPWGTGRPGWHIECSAMAMAKLGPSFDLHGGGLDLMFPHHENEIAISEAVTHQKYARHWMHNGFVEVDKQKMSKSLGNFFTARELFERVEPEAMRYYTMTAHYRAPMTLDWTLDDAGKVTGFPSIEDAERRVEYMYRTRERLSAVPAAKSSAPGTVHGDLDAVLEKGIQDALDDDLNMPAALAAIARFLHSVNELIDGTSRKNGAMTAAARAAADRGFALVATRLGLGGSDPNAFLLRIRARRARAIGLAEADVEQKIRERAEARTARDFARADAIRVELQARGIELHDAPNGTDWRFT